MMGWVYKGYLIVSTLYTVWNTPRSEAYICFKVINHKLAISIINDHKTIYLLWKDSILVQAACAMQGLRIIIKLVILAWESLFPVNQGGQNSTINDGDGGPIF